MSIIDNLKAKLVIVIGLLIINTFIKSNSLNIAIIIIGCVFITLPKVSSLLLNIWFKIADILNWINSKILLTIIYFFFLVPLAIISRFFTNDPLDLKKKSIKSLFHNRKHVYIKKDMENVW